MQSPAALPSRPPDVYAAVSIRRSVNDEVAQVASRFDAGEGNQFEFLCECGDLSCKRAVRMTVAQYRVSSPGSVIGHPSLAA